MRDDFIKSGEHYCGVCHNKFPEFLFHLAAGICNDCYDISIDESDDEREFAPCDKCNGQQNCEDFGCAYPLGLGRMVEKDKTINMEKYYYLIDGMTKLAVSEAPISLLYELDYWVADGKPFIPVHQKLSDELEKKYSDRSLVDEKDFMIGAFPKSMLGQEFSDSN